MIKALERLNGVITVLTDRELNTYKVLYPRTSAEQIVDLDSAVNNLINDALINYLDKNQNDSRYLGIQDTALKANQLEFPRYINITDGENMSEGVAFDGSRNIVLQLPKVIKADIDGNISTATSLKSPVNMNITDGINSSESSSFNGSQDVSLRLPSTIHADIKGNADTSSCWAQTTRRRSLSPSPA